MTSDNRIAPAGNMSGYLLNTSATAVSTGTHIPQAQPQETFREWLQKNVKEYPLTLDLPPEVWQYTALIVTYWSVAEWIQIGTVARLLNIERNAARVVFGARIGNLTGKIKELMVVRDITVATDMSALSALLAECEKRRNLLGHGVWLTDPENGDLCIENPSGEWTPPQEPKISRRKIPQAFHPTIPWFNETFENTKSAIQSLQKLDQEIRTAV